jgi:hypothetical protein
VAGGPPVAPPPAEERSSMISVPDLGIVGDGETDSTTGFLALRRRLLSDREREWTVEFPPGHYLTRAAHWLDGVGRVRLIGHGARLQQATANRGLFSTSEPFRTLTYDDANPDRDPIRVHHPGYRIGSVDAGATTLPILDGADRSAIVPGAVVLVGGFVQQTANNHLPLEQRIASGWPPNLRYFDYGVVRQVGADLVELERPLRFAYDADWRDYPGDHFGPYRAGAPRLYLCNRPGYDIARSIELHGFRFMRARGSTTGGHIGLSLSTLSLLLEDVTIQETDPADERSLSTFVQMNDQVTLRRCRLDDLEIDKCLRQVVIEDCEIRGLTSDGAGALEVEIRRSRIYGDLRVNPRASVVIDNATAFRNFSLNAQHGGYYDTDPFAMTMGATRS